MSLFIMENTLEFSLFLFVTNPDSPESTSCSGKHLFTLTSVWENKYYRSKTTITFPSPGAREEMVVF